MLLASVFIVHLCVLTVCAVQETAESPSVTAALLAHMPGLRSVSILLKKKFQLLLSDDLAEAFSDLKLWLRTAKLGPKIFFASPVGPPNTNLHCDPRQQSFLCVCMFITKAIVMKMHTHTHKKANNNKTTTIIGLWLKCLAAVKLPSVSTARLDLINFLLLSFDDLSQILLFSTVFCTHTHKHTQKINCVSE